MKGGGGGGRVAVIEVVRWRREYSADDNTVRIGLL